MKNKRKILFLILLFISFAYMTYAADPPPLDDDPTSSGGTSIGGSAPVDLDYWFTLLLAISYGSYKYFKKSIHLKLFHHEK